MYDPGSREHVSGAFTEAVFKIRLVLIEPPRGDSRATPSNKILIGQSDIGIMLSKLPQGGGGHSAAFFGGRTFLSVLCDQCDALVDGFWIGRTCHCISLSGVPILSDNLFIDSFCLSPVVRGFAA